MMQVHRHLNVEKSIFLTQKGVMVLIGEFSV